MYFRQNLQNQYKIPAESVAHCFPMKNRCLRKNVLAPLPFVIE